jgi:hypothetical protein
MVIPCIARKSNKRYDEGKMRSGWTFLLTILLVPVAIVFSVETLPMQLSDSEFWKMISDFSEPAGYYQYNVITSNEQTYQYSIPDLMKTPRTGGAYLGVGPEQNFTYIAALQPKIAFIFDIRREMMLEHLIYKSVFEMSANRVEFVANLFSRKVPAQLGPDSSVGAIFQAFERVPADPMLAGQNANMIVDRLKTRHHFALNAEDERGIRTLYRTFSMEGVQFFGSSFLSPGYAYLMTLTDGRGKNWSYLASRENYDRIRLMQQQNLIVPVVGDFAGPKAIRAAGQYLKDHGATVHVFYISNVEDYIQAKSRYAGNIASLPTDASSVLLRWYIGGHTEVDSIADFLRRQHVVNSR